MNANEKLANAIEEIEDEKLKQKIKDLFIKWLDENIALLNKHENI
jgi:hypothetical protein